MYKILKASQSVKRFEFYYGASWFHSYLTNRPTDRVSGIKL